MNGNPIRIGTRDSILATWQARYVLNHLSRAGYKAELRFIKTEGDRVLDTPLPLMGGKGVFTKALDDALLAGEIDLAVHSLKDIPTRLPGDLAVGAVSKREDTADVLVTRHAAIRYVTEKSEESQIQGAPNAPDSPGSVHTTNVPGSANIPNSPSSSISSPGFLNDPRLGAVIASSSNRRIGQWLARYPMHQMTDIRGNVQTRLHKLAESDWDGAIFAAAGLIRLDLDRLISHILDWMLPAPAQGAMAVMIRENDRRIRKAIEHINDPVTALCTSIERDVLHTLEGGCSAPVGALAVSDGEIIRLRVNTVYPDGTGLMEFEMKEAANRAHDLGKRAADEALRCGVDVLIRDLKGEEKAENEAEAPGARTGSGTGPDSASGSGSGSASDSEPGPNSDTETGSERTVVPSVSAAEKPRIVLSTRLATSADVALARKQGIRLIDYPAWIYRWVTPPAGVIGSVFDGPSAGSKPDAWVFTSRRGVEGWWRALIDKSRIGEDVHSVLKQSFITEKTPVPDQDRIPPVYAIGERTVEALRKTFATCEIRVPEGRDGASLGKNLAAEGIRHAIHFCGTERRQELTYVCRKHNITLTEVEVYERRSVMLPKPLNVAFDAILFYSPDGVSEFCRMYGVPAGEWHAVAIGKTTAEAVRRETGRDPLIPKTPAFDEMIKLVS